MVELLLDGKSLADMVPGTMVTMKPAIPAAEREVKTTPVSGRLHGDLTQKLGWKDVSWSPEMALVDFDDINAAWRRTRSILLNATKLSMSDDPGFYRLIKSVHLGELAIDDVEVSGNYKPAFVLDPLEYQETQEQTFTGSFDISNPGNVNAEPLIRVSGSGTVKISVNTDEFSIDTVTSEVTLDCAKHTATMGGKDITMSTKGLWPSLKPGKNHIVLTGATKIVITPRWCYA